MSAQVGDTADMGSVTDFRDLVTPLHLPGRRGWQAPLQCGGYVALCPELDIASQGDSILKCAWNLEEAVSLFLETDSPQEAAERFHSRST